MTTALRLCACGLPVPGRNWQTNRCNACERAYGLHRVRPEPTAPVALPMRFKCTECFAATDGRFEHLRRIVCGRCALAYHEVE